MSLPGASDEPDAKDDACTAFSTEEDQSFTTGNLLVKAREQHASDNSSVSTLVAGAPLGLLMDNGDGPVTHRPDGDNAEPRIDNGDPTPLRNRLDIGAE